MKNESGFTLVEVIIALLLITLLVIGMAAMPSKYRLLRARARVTAVASSYAQSMLDRTRKQNYNSIVSVPSQNALGLAATDTNKNLNLNYQYSILVQNYVLNSPGGTTIDSMLTLNNTIPNPDLKRITVTVNWNGELAGQTQLSTIVHNPTPPPAT